MDFIHAQHITTYVFVDYNCQIGSLETIMRGLAQANRAGKIGFVMPVAPGDPLPTGHAFEPHEQGQLKQGDKAFCQKVTKSGRLTNALHGGTLT